MNGETIGEGMVEGRREAWLGVGGERLEERIDLNQRKLRWRKKGGEKGREEGGGRVDLFV